MMATTGNEPVCSNAHWGEIQAAHVMGNWVNQMSHADGAGRPRTSKMTRDVPVT